MSLQTFGNIYAPAWMGYSPVIAGMEDYEFDLDLQPVQVASGTFVLGNNLAIDNDADYLVREFQFVVTAVTVDGTSSTTTAQASDIRVRIRDGQGRLFTSDFIPIADLNGPLCPPWPIRRGSNLIIDYQNINTTVAQIQTVWMLLKGWKRNPCPSLNAFTPPYTPMYRQYPKPAVGQELEDFEYPFTFTASGALDLLKIPLQTDNDADFWWCGITGDWNTANNPFAVVGNVGVTFYDAIGLPISGSGLINPWGSTLGALFRESIFSSGGARPTPIYPAIFIPGGGVLLIDISFGQAATLRFSLRGKKVYGKCA
jgi:hypothetical protein